MKFIVSTLLLVACSFSTLKAQTIFQVFNFDNSNFSFEVESDSALSDNFSLQPALTAVFDLFDPSLGDLTGVSIVYELSFGGNIQANAIGGGGSYSVDANIFLGSDLIGSIDNGGGNFAPPNSTVDFNFFIAQTFTIISSDLTAEMVTGTGTGTLTTDFTINFTADPDVILSGRLLTDSVNNSFSRIVVAYDYTPIPEPRATALVIGGLLVGLIALRQSSRKAA